MTSAIARKSLLAGAAILLVSGISGAIAQTAAPSPQPAQSAGEAPFREVPVSPSIEGKKASDIDNPANPFAGRGATLPAVLRKLVSDNVKLTALGNEGGFPGYLAEAANGRYQVLYAAPDGEHVVAGMLFETGGRNVTNDQIAEMLRRFGEAARATPNVDVSQLPTIPPLDSHEKVEAPILDWFAEKGMKITDMKASDGGLNAFLVETQPKNGVPGRMQMFYRAPDARFAVAGLLLNRSGGNMTGYQIGKMQERALAEAQLKDKDHASKVVPGNADAPAPPKVLPTDLVEQTAPVAKVPAAVAPAAAEAAPATPAAATEAPVNQSLLIPATPEAPKPVQVKMDVSSEPPTSAERFRSNNITSTDFTNALKSTVFFTVGVADKPALYMVVDPQCPFCHEMWRRLKPLVFNHVIQVRVIMIAGLRGSDPLARSILTREDPGKAWLSGEGSIDSVKVKDGPAPGSKEWDRAGAFLEMNANFIKRFGVAQTPFLAYTAPDGSFITSRGIPDDVDAFLAALR